MAITMTTTMASGCEICVDALVTRIGPAVPVARAATAVRLSERSVTVAIDHWVSPSDQLAVAFSLPGPIPSAPIVAIAVARGSSAAGDRWWTELAFEQLSTADAARIAAYVGHRPFASGF